MIENIQRTEDFQDLLNGWLRRQKIKFENSSKNLSELIEKEYGSFKEDVLLLVDGGSENNNKLVDTYIYALPKLTKLRALRDIIFGNTQIEAHNRILKQGWLYRREFQNEEELRDEVDKFVHEFNEIQPHDSIGGLTSPEKHAGAKDYNNASYIKLSQQARQDRYESNRCNACSTCSMNCML